MRIGMIVAMIVFISMEADANEDYLVSINYGYASVTNFRSPEHYKINFAYSGVEYYAPYYEASYSYSSDSDTYDTRESVVFSVLGQIHSFQIFAGIGGVKEKNGQNNGSFVLKPHLGFGVTSTNPQKSQGEGRRLEPFIHLREYVLGRVVHIEIGFGLRLY